MENPAMQDCLLEKCNGVMGVPITMLDKFNPDQFEIVAFRKGDDGKDLVFTREREREFNRTFEFSFNSNRRIAEQSKRYKSQWEEYLCQNNYQAKIEPIDLFFPLIMRGCAEPYLNLQTIRDRGLAEYPSRQIKYNNHICQKTYHRLFIRKK